jgi:hypothetical protein
VKRKFKTPKIIKNLLITNKSKESGWVIMVFGATGQVH